MAENKDEFENWTIPKFDESNETANEEKTVFGKPATWYNNQDKAVEEVDVENSPKPLTLDDIEVIRLAAYEDGFNEGKETGFSTGFEEGKLEGLTAGHTEGLEQGLQEGLVQGADEIEQQATIWQGLIERLHNPLEKLDENTEYQLVRLATVLAEQITRCEVQTSQQIILKALKKAVDALPISDQKLSINLHPDDLLFVQNAYSQEQCQQRGWDLQAEPALMRGDCQINTQVSSVDFTFDSRIDQVLKHFFKENYQQLPSKNDDSDLSHDQPMPPENNIQSEDDNDADTISDTSDIAEKIDE